MGMKGGWAEKHKATMKYSKNMPQTPPSSPICPPPTLSSSSPSPLIPAPLSTTHPLHIWDGWALTSRHRLRGLALAADHHGLSIGSTGSEGS